MKRIVITGGPCCGKTTLIGELERRIPSANFLEEAAAKIISLELARESKEEGYKGNLPWHDSEKFQHRVIDLTLEMEQAVSPGNLVIQDRGVLDNIAYARLGKVSSVEARAISLAKAADYDLTVFCEPFPYEATEIRREDPQSPSGAQFFSRKPQNDRFHRP